MQLPGLLTVVSAPSGAGKGSLLTKAFEQDARLKHSVSATTRDPRAGEVPGVHYEFIDPETFREWIREDRLLEWAEVHGNYYGTPRGPLIQMLADSHDVVLELDVQGMRSVRAMYPEAVTVFIAPPSMEILGERLRGRGAIEDSEFNTRMQNAELEMAAQGEYDHVIVNDDLNAAVAEFLAFVEKGRRGLEIR